MRVGIIAEGTEDQSVIKNILRAFDIDGYSIRPSLSVDESRKHLANQSTIGIFVGFFFYENRNLLFFRKNRHYLNNLWR